MTPFAYLFVAHLIGDYLFQTNWMAANKTKDWRALLVHSVVYTAILSIVAYLTFGGLSIWGIMILLITHIILDQRSFTIWWVETIMKTNSKQFGWLVIMVDQTFHIITIAVVLHFFL